MAKSEHSLEHTIASNEAEDPDYYAPPEAEPLRAYSIDGHTRLRIGHGRERVLLQITGRGHNAIVLDPVTARVVAERLLLQADEADDVVEHSHDDHARIRISDGELDV